MIQARLKREDRKIIEVLATYDFDLARHMDAVEVNKAALNYIRALKCGDVTNAKERHIKLSQAYIKRWRP